MDGKGAGELLLRPASTPPPAPLAWRARPLTVRVAPRPAGVDRRRRHTVPTPSGYSSYQICCDPDASPYVHTFSFLSAIPASVYFQMQNSPSPRYYCISACDVDSVSTFTGKLKQAIYLPTGVTGRWCRSGTMSMGLWMGGMLVQEPV
jgi:hypothetical protein